MHDFSRRALLASAGQYLALTYASPFFALGQEKIAGNPFTLGVASGDPTSDGVVLWTRLAPDPLNGGGMPPNRVEVEWQIATDEQMGKVVKKGRATATPDLAHSVHVEVRGLEPARWYWYRFKAGSHVSDIGRTRTAPDPKKPLDKLSFAFASCQHYEAGYFTAYQHMAHEDIELVVHLGDYIYEGAMRPGRPRQHTGPELASLSDYRNRYALYRNDPDLQKAHALFPWIVTWDDHEVDNNYAGENRRTALRATHFSSGARMPTRHTTSTCRCDGNRCPKVLRCTCIGDLLSGILPNFRYWIRDSTERTNLAMTATSRSVRPRLRRGNVIRTRAGAMVPGWLSRSRAKWNIIAQQVMMAKVDRRAGPEQAYAMDQWSGYEAARNRILAVPKREHPSNPVVLTGDIHSNWVADLKLDFSDEKSPTVGTEFVGTSITSGGNGATVYLRYEAYLPENPHVHFYNNQRGYVRCLLTPDKWQTDYRVLPFVEKPGADIRYTGELCCRKRASGRSALVRLPDQSPSELEDWPSANSA